MASEGPSAPRPDLSEGSSKKRARPGYDEAQKALIARCIDQGMGYRKIIKQYPDMGFTLDGLKSALARWRKNGTLGRKVGSGAKRTSRTAEAVEEERVFFEENNRASCRQAVAQLGLSRSTARRILINDLDIRPLRQVTAQRIKPANTAKRLELCRIWDEGFRSGSLGAEKIFFTEEKVFRTGACPGGNRNFAAYVKKGLGKSEAPNNLILREGGMWQGGVGVMVCLGLSFRGKGNLHYVPAGVKINGAEYLTAVKIYTSRTATKCTEYRRRAYSNRTAPPPPTRVIWYKHTVVKSSPPSGAKGHGRPNSPDLNVLDYFCWGYLQREVERHHPRCLDPIKLAIRRSVEAMPLSMAQRAILSFPKRVKMRIEAGGGTFKHTKYQAEEIADYPVVEGDIEDGESEGAED